MNRTILSGSGGRRRKQYPPLTRGQSVNVTANGLKKGKECNMFSIQYVAECKDESGSCASCGKRNADDKKMIRVRIGHKKTGIYQGFTFHLCDDCRKKLREVI